MSKKFFFDLKSSLFIKNDFRRSLFNNAERGKFLNQLVAGVRKILLNPQVTKIQWLQEKKEKFVTDLILIPYRALTLIKIEKRSIKNF